MTGERAYTVIIPSKDRVGMLREALDSVFAQTLPPSSVQLVVDEPSDDKKYAFLSRYDSRLELHFTGGGFGGARARNVGLDRVATPFVFFLDDDDLWYPTKVERQIAALEEHAGWLGVTCWRSEGDGRSRTEVRVSQRQLEKYSRTKNVAGSLSQFGLRIDSNTKLLRLEPSLRSAQDFEFYLQVWGLGTIGIVSEVLVQYRISIGARITGSDSVKHETLEGVYRKHCRSLNGKEKRFWRANLASNRLLARDGGASGRIGDCLGVLANLLLSGSLMFGGGKMIRRVIAFLIRRNRP